MSMPDGIARFDSAAGMARALGAFLHDERFDSLTGSPTLDRMLPLVNLLPRTPRESFYAFAGTVEALRQSQLRALDVQAIARWLAGLYPNRHYPAAFIGSSSGALVHLAAAIGAPWLPQTFLCPVRHLGADPDDARAAFAAGSPLVETLLRVAPDMAVHHMHDPNQDRLMLRTMSYYRLKYRRLPAAYRDALMRWLPPGATLYLVNCTRRWPVTRTSDRSVFQFGAVGGAGADEYRLGSERVREYLARYDAGRSQWDPPAADDQAPEAEWGFDEALRAGLGLLAEEQNWRLVEIRFEDPEALSEVSARLHSDWYAELDGAGPERLLADSFVLMAPREAQRLRAIPFWLVFSVEPSADHLARFLDTQPRYEQVDLSVFSHGTEGVGLAPIQAWQRLASRGRRPGRLLGVDPSRYPRDFATFTRYFDAVRELAPVSPAPPSLSLTRFEALLGAHAAPCGVELHPVPAAKETLDTPHRDCGYPRGPGAGRM